jgi:hypothetical protein
MHSCLLVKPQFCRVQTNPSTSQYELLLPIRVSVEQKEQPISPGAYLSLKKELEQLCSTRTEMGPAKGKCGQVFPLTAIFKEGYVSPLSWNPNLM